MNARQQQRNPDRREPHGHGLPKALVAGLRERVDIEPEDRSQRGRRGDPVLERRRGVDREPAQRTARARRDRARARGASRAARAEDAGHGDLAAGQFTHEVRDEAVIHARRDPVQGGHGDLRGIDERCRIPLGVHEPLEKPGSDAELLTEPVGASPIARGPGAAQPAEPPDLDRGRGGPRAFRRRHEQMSSTGLAPIQVVQDRR
jgi:hypothetical protein